MSKGSKGNRAVQMALFLPRPPLSPSASLALSLRGSPPQNTPSIPRLCGVSFRTPSSSSLRFGHNVWANCPLLPACDTDGWEGGHYASSDFEDGITFLPKKTFFKNKKVKTVMLPATVTRIEAAAFQACSNLERAILPSGLKVLPARLFSDCAKLKLVPLPSTVVTIGEYAFSACKALRTITLPAALRALGKFSFNECENLYEIIFGSATLKTSLKYFGVGLETNKHPPTPLATANLLEDAAGLRRPLFEATTQATPSAASRCGSLLLSALC